MDLFITEFTRIRTAILAAITTAGINDGNKLTNVNSLPDDLSSGFQAAIVSLERETGKDATRKRFVSTDLAFDIFLVVDAATDIADPDLALYTLKEAFRDAYLASVNKDFASIEYYPSYVDGTHPVKICKLTTQTEKN